MGAEAKAAEPKAVGVMEAAAMLRVGRTTVKKLVRERLLKSFKIGRALRIPVASIEDFIRRGDGDEDERR